MNEGDFVLQGIEVSVAVHPKFTADDGDEDLFKLFFSWRGGDMGRGPLPFSGGTAEQPAALMEAFEYLAAVYAKIKKFVSD